MIKYLELLLELLWSSNEEDYSEIKKLYLAVGKKQEERGDKLLKVFHKNGFIFLAYEDLRTDKITLDEFLSVGDITSQRKIVPDEMSSQGIFDGILNKNELNIKNTMIIVDAISFSVLSDSEKSFIQNWTKQNDNELIIC